MMQGARPVGFLLHASVAMVIGPVAWMVFALGVVIVLGNSHEINALLNAGDLANPSVWGPGLILGLLVNRFTLSTVARWVWLAGMVWMACGIFGALLSYHARFAGICSPLDSVTNGFFSFFPKQPYCGDHGNLSLFTLPALSSVAYSIGASITLWSVHHSETRPDPIKR